MATLEITFLHNQLEERKRRLETAMALSPQKAGLAGLLHEVDSVLRRKAACCPGDAITSCLDDLRSFMDTQLMDDLTLLAIQRSGVASS